LLQKGRSADREFAFFGCLDGTSAFPAITPFAGLVGDDKLGVIHARRGPDHRGQGHRARSVPQFKNNRGGIGRSPAEIRKTQPSHARRRRRRRYWLSLDQAASGRPWGIGLSVLVIELPITRTATALVAVTSVVHPADRIETRMEPGTGLAYAIAGTRPTRRVLAVSGNAPRYVATSGVPVAVVSAWAPTGSLAASEGWFPVMRTLAGAGASEARRMTAGVAGVTLSDPAPTGTSDRRAGWPLAIATEDAPTGSVLRSAGALPTRTRDAGLGAAVLFADVATVGVADARLSETGATGIVRRTCGVAAETLRLPVATVTSAFT
jgi:hypothetical protein